MTERSIVAIVGSTRAESWNNRLAHAADLLAPTTMHWEIVRSDLPLYDGDADASDVPDTVTSLRSAVAAADGVVVVTPEYNYGLPGPLKNTLDWLSRPAFLSPLRDKPVTSLGSTPGPGNAGRALVSLNQCFIAMAAAPYPGRQPPSAG
jgi:chromate reductase, NAD(P)H dehydrogenase (quinone)